MEGAASVIGVVGVATITIQLAESIKKLSDFWSSVKEAPSDVQAIIDDLDLLCSVFKSIGSDIDLIEDDLLLERVLCNCVVTIKPLGAILQDIQRGFASTKRSVRKWTAIKSVLKWDKIKKFQEILDRLKGTLMLVQQKYGLFERQICLLG